MPPLSIPAQLRKAALGRTPVIPDFLYNWVEYGALRCTEDYLVAFFGPTSWAFATDTERRMFLLFVAEALESQA